MCCLKYENDNYESAKDELPDLGREVATPMGYGRVVGLNILERKVQVDLYEVEQVMDLPLEEISVVEKVQ